MKQLGVMGLLLCCSLVFAAPEQVTLQQEEQAPKKLVHIYNGSLKVNIQRLMKSFGWKKVVWRSPNDYHWVNDTDVNVSDAQELLYKMLSEYPLSASLYEGNKVIVIAKRED